MLRMAKTVVTVGMHVCFIEPAAPAECAKLTEVPQHEPLDGHVDNRKVHRGTG